MAKRRDTAKDGDLQVGHDTHIDMGQDAFTKLQSHYLSYLDRLINLKNKYLTDPECEQWLVRAIDRATYSAFRSCVENGVEHDAKNLLTAERRTN